MAKDYTTYITSEHADKPNFLATITALTEGAGQISDMLQSLPQKFDVDLAVGDQLDAVGKWVGFSRQLVAPIAGVFFSWDTAGLGWDQGNWKGPFEPTQGIVTLDDQTYRFALKGKIAANYWDGTVDSLLVISTTGLADLGVSIVVEDNMDMSTDNVYILGGSLYAALLALIKRGVFPPKAAGVRINGYYLSSFPGAPFFGLDVENSYVSGLDVGAWAVAI
jgi:hypothetical protein